MPLKRVELAIVSSVFILLDILLTKFALGGPLSSDVAWYVNVALNGIKDPFILNRYFHVFLQALFVWGASTPLAGIQAFWAAQVAATAFLVYINTRLFSSKSTPVHGALAVGIFLSNSIFAEWTGIPFVDLTTMFLVMLIVMVYLLWLSRQDRCAWLVITLGALAYLAIRTKETALWFFVILIGIGFTQSDTFQWKTFFKNLVYLALGGLVGIVFLGLLNQILIHDLLWGLRPAEWHSYWLSYIEANSDVPLQANRTNWYTGYLTTTLLIPFLLYLISGIKLLPEITRARRILGLIPLAGAIFLIATMNNRWGFHDRFFLTAFPAVSMLAVQFLDLEIPITKKAWLKLALILTGGVGLAILLRFGFRSFVYRAGIDFGQWLDIVFQPALITVLLAVLFLSRRTTSWSLLAVICCLSALLISPLVANARTMFIERPIYALTQFKYYPFTAFEAEITYTPEMQLSISPGISQLIEKHGNQGTSMLAADRNELISMFNIYYNARATENNIYILSADTDLANQILTARCTYIILTIDEWKTVSANPPQAAAVMHRYYVFTDEKGSIVLLKSR